MCQKPQAEVAAGLEEEADHLTMTMTSERMPEYAREFFDQQQHQNEEEIVEPPYQV